LIEKLTTFGMSVYKYQINPNR